MRTSGLAPRLAPLPDEGQQVSALALETKLRRYVAERYIGSGQPADQPAVPPDLEEGVANGQPILAVDG